MDQICVKAPMGMTGGVCSPNGGPCDPAHDMCGNDQYCCGAGCRIDGSNDPVCVSGGSRPVNTMCNTKASIGGHSLSHEIDAIVVMEFFSDISPRFASPFGRSGSSAGPRDPQAGPHA